MDLSRNKLDESKNIFVSRLKEFDVWQSLELVGDNPKFRYIGSLMGSERSLNFKGYETLDDVKNDMRHYNNFCQWIRATERFLYFDIDNVLLNEIEFKSYIDRFIDCLNTHLCDDNYIRVTSADFQYHTKLSKSGHIKSIHIVSNKYYMSYKQMNALVNKMETTIKEIDACIYGKGRAFFNCFNGKCGSRQFYYHEINAVPYELIWIDAPQLSDKSERVQYKQVIDTTKELHVDNFLEYLIENRNKFLVKTCNWIMMCSYVKHYNLMSRDAFCVRSLVGKYTFEQNVRMWDALHSRAEAENSMEDLCRIICKQTLITDAFDDDFLAGIEMDKETIQSIKNNKDHDIDISYADKCGKIRCFNRKTGILHYDDGTSSLAMADDKLSRETLEFKYIDVDELPQYYDQSRVFIRALYGVGKTHHFIRPVVQKHKDNDGSILFITENNVLNAQFSKKFGLVSHTSKDYTDDFQVVTSLESFIKFKRTEYDLVVLDEFVSLMAQFKSSTMARVSHQDVVAKLLKVIRDATQIVVTDADLSENTYPTILDAIQPRINRMILSVRTDNYNGYKYHFVFDEQDFNQRLDEDLKNNLRVSVAVTIRSIAEAIYNHYKDTKKIIFVSRDKTIINGTELSEADVIKFKCGSLDKYFTENKIDLFVYSPTITTGLSIDDLYFDKQYGYAKALEQAPPPRTLLQMIHRTRKIRDPTIVIYTPKPRITQTDYDVRYMESHYNVTAQRMKQNGYTYSVNKLICDIENETDAEKLYGEKNFTEALYIMLRRHGLDVVLGTEKLSDKSENCNFSVLPQIERMILFVVKVLSKIDVEKDARDIAERSLNNQYFDGMKFKIYSLMMDVRIDDIAVKSVYRDKNDKLQERVQYKSYTFNGVYQPDYFMGLMASLHTKRTKCGTTYIQDGNVVLSASIGTLTLKPLLERIIHVKQIKNGWRTYDNRIERKKYFDKHLNNNKDASVWMRETIKIDIREWMDSLSDNNRITELSAKFKITPEMLENLNSLRRGKQKPLKIDETSRIFNFINYIMTDAYGYSYVMKRRYADEAILVKLPYITFGGARPQPLDERMGLKLMPTTVTIGNEYDWNEEKIIVTPITRQIYPQYIEQKQFQQETQNVYGYKVSNKYNHQKRLRDLYDQMKLLCSKREYIITPSKGTLALFNGDREMTEIPPLMRRGKEDFSPILPHEIGYGWKFRVDTP